MAAFTSAYGNYRYSVLFETQDTIAFQQSHAMFFEHIGRVYNTMVYDNMKVAVAKFVGPNEKQATQGLLKLSIYYGFNFRFCNVRAGNEKGHVERSVEYIRRKAFSFKDTFSSLEEVNGYLLDICIKLNNKILSTDKSSIPMELLKRELPYMLPKMPMFDSSEVKDLRVDKYSTIIYKQNRYSVPDKYTGKMVFVKAYADKIKIFYDSILITEHIRTFGLFDWNIKLEHYLDTLHKKSGALANSTAMLKLDTQIKSIYEKHYTDNPKDFLDLYEIILEKGLECVQSAIQELLNITPTNITTDKIKLICDRADLPVIENSNMDEITRISKESLIHYALLIPNRHINSASKEVLV